MTLQVPVVLVNGVIFPQTLGPLSYFHQLTEAFPGIKFYLIALPAWGTQKKRLSLLKEELENLKLKEFHFLGHSQAGLEGRWMLEEPELRARFVSLTSLNTPFRGTQVLEYFPFLKSHWGHFLDLLNNPMKAQLNVPHFCANTYIHQVEDFKHFPLFKWLEPRLKKMAGVNDGFVPLESMRMGEEILLNDGDHLANVGWPLHIGNKLLGSMHPHLFFEQIFKHLAQYEHNR